MSCFRKFLAVAVLIAGGGAAPGVEKPRLAVLVVFDQLRGDYLTRWQDLFGPGGFRRLEKKGAWFKNCHYPYSLTNTGPGHASLITGCSPARHGIIGNEWYDRQTGDLVNCAYLDRYRNIPAPLTGVSKETGSKSKRGGGSPERMQAVTVGELLKEATGGKGRVVSLSLKDRGAVLPGGKTADACYWLDTNTGDFCTSTYYRDRVHPWMEKFNQGRHADRWFDHDWERLRPDLDYERHSGPDDVLGEARGIAQGRTFPHPMSALSVAPDRVYYEALYNSPFANELLLALAKCAVNAEQLGADDVPDLLCLSFSANDPVGHCWGPDSQEVLDVTLRADAIVENLLNFLDATVGENRYVLVLSADHGVAPLPEVARAQGKKAGRIDPKLLRLVANAVLNDEFAGEGEQLRWIDAVDNGWIYLNGTLLRKRGLDAAKVEETLANWLKKQPAFLAAYTRTQLRNEPADAGDTLLCSVKRSFSPARSGDVAVVVRPYYQIISTLSGTGHGTPHAYDTHVPLIVFGTGVRKGVRSDATTPLAAASILCSALQMSAPAGVETKPASLFQEP